MRQNEQQDGRETTDEYAEENEHLPAEGGLTSGPRTEPVTFGTPVYTSILIACFVGVSIAQFSADLERSVIVAGFVKPIFVSGEYWRILTGAALHGGVLHLFLNSFAFFSFGRLFEGLSNRAHLPIVFLLAAVGGGVLSLIFKPNGTSVGASGGILGVVSYLAVYTFARRQFVSPAFRKDMLVNVAFILAFGLVLYDIIDNYGHVGGLIVGAVYGLIQIPRDPYVDPRAVSSRVESTGLAFLAAWIAISGFSIFLILSYGG